MNGAPRKPARERAIRSGGRSGRRLARRFPGAEWNPRTTVSIQLPHPASFSFFFLLISRQDSPPPRAGLFLTRSARRSRSGERKVAPALRSRPRRQAIGAMAGCRLILQLHVSRPETESAHPFADPAAASGSFSFLFIFRHLSDPAAHFAFSISSIS
jgi:hypothetical protein